MTGSEMILLLGGIEESRYRYCVQNKLTKSECLEIAYQSVLDEITCLEEGKKSKRTCRYFAEKYVQDCITSALD